MADTETRPVRVCDKCGQVDDHPRHVLAAAPDQGTKVDNPVYETALFETDWNQFDDPKAARQTVLAQIRDTSLVSKHMDCCREDGCDVCAEVTAGAEELRGAELVNHLTQEN